MYIGSDFLGALHLHELKNTNVTLKIEGDTQCRLDAYIIVNSTNTNRSHMFHIDTGIMVMQDVSFRSYTLAEWMVVVVGLLARFNVSLRHIS